MSKIGAKILVVVEDELSLRKWDSVPICFSRVPCVGEFVVLPNSGAATHPQRDEPKKFCVTAVTHYHVIDGDADAEIHVRKG